MGATLERQFLERAIGGALRATINDHGPITKNLISSATKRVIGAVLNTPKPCKDKKED